MISLFFIKLPTFLCHVTVKINFPEPVYKTCPSCSADMPLPSKALQFTTGLTGHVGSSTEFTIALARGCSLLTSKRYADGLHSRHFHDGFLHSGLTCSTSHSCYNILLHFLLLIQPPVKDLVLSQPVTRCGLFQHFVQLSRCFSHTDTVYDLCREILLSESIRETVTSSYACRCFVKFIF